MKKLLIAEAIHPDALQVLRETWEVSTVVGALEEFVQREGDFEGLVVRSGTRVTANVLEAGKFRVVAKTGAGLDNVDVDAARRLGIDVLHTPDTPSRSVAELVIGLTLSLLRNIQTGNDGIREGRWPKADCVGLELRGMRFGILGSGRIAAEVCALLGPFGTEIQLCSPNLSDERARRLGGVRVDFGSLIASSDVISIHVPKTSGTRGLIGARELSLMKQSGVLINTARGGIVDERELAKALAQGSIAGAALDVFETEPPTEDLFAGLANVIRTPHIGASTQQAQRNAGMEIAAKLASYA